MYMHIVYIQYTLCEVLNEVPTYNFQKYPLTPPILRRGAVAKICSRNKKIFNHEAQHAKNTFEHRLSIPLRFI